ncbi:Protein FAM160B2 [Oryzias melastigma]|uniref:Protein FAM160B2 n=1 Tax=Oryzias melastigma TaxID=30732 RepID=A0A834FKK7_ORYME|nr:Protein FAM160B2 [Oryzias melastigma]
MSEAHSTPFLKLPQTKPSRAPEPQERHGQNHTSHPPTQTQCRCGSNRDFALSLFGLFTFSHEARICCVSTRHFGIFRRYCSCWWNDGKVQQQNRCGEALFMCGSSQVIQCQTLSLSWDWLASRRGGPLPYELNLQLTAVLSRLSACSRPLLQEYLLDPNIPLSPCSLSSSDRNT